MITYNSAGTQLFRYNGGPTVFVTQSDKIGLIAHRIWTIISKFENL